MLKKIIGLLLTIGILSCSKESNVVVDDKGEEVQEKRYEIIDIQYGDTAL